MLQAPLHSGFAPDHLRAIALDRAMRAGLADSVEMIAGALLQVGARPSPQVAAALEAIRRHPCQPACFGHYFEMAGAASADDASAAAEALSAFALSTGTASLARIVTLDDAEMEAGSTRLYQRVANDDPDVPMILTAPLPGETMRARADIEQALQLIEFAEPAMAGEMAVVGRQIVLADGRSGDNFFGGAATFFLWGALLINPRFNKGRLAMAEALAHESGHALLFALADAEALTVNPPEETYTSPLRADPRPMEGIVHATYVLARMNWLLRAIAARCELTGDECAVLASMMAENTRGFVSGLETVRAHARFSARGKEIFEGCVGPMLQASAC